MAELENLKCVPCRGGEPTVSEEEIEELAPQVPDWKIVEQDGVKRLERTFKFKNFVEALNFTNQIGELAEQENHHPRVVTEWGKVTLTWWTHVIKGLHTNDFIMAAKSDAAYEKK
jgi:4a-hydroxytetrahydrobiopterin dehydratase